MTGGREDIPHDGETTQDCTLVWIDAREAVVARWRAGEVRLERLGSDVPPRRRATGHVRHDPAVRHGGGAPQDAGEGHRLEHLTRFIDLVATHVTPDENVVILGPGTVRDRLSDRVREADRIASRSRHVCCETASRLTDPQIVARLRHMVGADPRRRTASAARGVEPAKSGR